MYQEKLKEWLLNGANGGSVKVSRSQFSVLVGFANWLDRAAELQRAVDQHEQKCPLCFNGWVIGGDGLMHECPNCNRTGISNRSVGN